MDNDALLGEVGRKLAGVTGLVKAIVFGSRARGNEREDSDLDLMVVMEQIGSVRERSWEIRRRLLDVHVPIDLVVYTPPEYERLRAWQTSVAGLADREGRVLVG